MVLNGHLHERGLGPNTTVTTQHYRKISMMKDFYDERTKPPNFQVGDQVFLFKPTDKTATKEVWQTILWAVLSGGDGLRD